MVKKRVSLAVVSILVSGVLMIFGCGYNSHGERAEQMTEKIASRLDLYDSQKEQLNGLKEELIDDRRQLRISRLTIEGKLIDQLRNEKIDQGQLKEAIAKERAKRDEMVSSVVIKLAAFHDSLSPKQRSKLIEMVEEWDSHRKRHHQ
jgi:hypothetical protein